MGQTYYELLGVDTDATTAEIRAAFRERIKEAHPDVNDSPAAQDQTAALLEARAVLTNPKRRARYDRQSRSERSDSDSSAESGGSRTNGTEGDSRSTSASQSSRSSSRTTTSGASSNSGRHAESSSDSTASNEWRRGSGARSTATDAGSSADDGASGGHSASATRDRWTSEERESSTAESTSRGGGFRSSRATATASYSYEFDVGRAATAAWMARILAALGLWFGGLLALYGVTGRELVHTPVAIVVAIASLGVAFVGYDVVLERSSKNARRASGTPETLPRGILRLAAVNLTGIALLETAANDPFTFFATVVISIGVTTIVVGSLIAVFFGLFAGIRGALAGFVLGTAVGVLLVFTGWLGQPYQELVAAAGLPWVPAMSVASVRLGVLANVLLAGWMLLAVGGTTLWFLCRFAVIPWRDRYERGYRVRPGVWQTLLVLPVVVAVGVPLLGIPRPALGGIDLWGAALYPLMGAPLAVGVPYYCRLALERTLRRNL